MSLIGVLVYDPGNTSVQYQYKMRVVPGTFDKKKIYKYNNIIYNIYIIYK